MTTIRPLVWIAVCVLSAGRAAVAQEPLDVRRGVPPEVFLAAYTQHNPERDYQDQYYEQVWNTVRETRIVERALQIVASRISAEQREQAQGLLDEVQAALEPLDVQAIVHCKAVVYAQLMEAMTSQHLLLMQSTPEAAAGCVQSAKNLFALIEKRSNGRVRVETTNEGDLALTCLTFPGPLPFRLTVTHTGDVFLFASSERLARASLTGLLGKRGTSKFDDERLQEALRRLPAAEDSIVFYDGRTQFDQMRGMFDALAQQAAGEPEAQRWLGIARKVLDELAFIDYQVQVEYTDGYQNRSASFGRLSPGYENRLLTKVLGSGQPFTDWQRWVPADATSYALSSGANLHPVYEYVIDFLNDNVPEAKVGLERFEQGQERIGVHLDRDILQAFSGESISIKMPASNTTVFGGQESILALRCQQPDRTRELLHRLVDELNKIPAFKAQQLQLKPCEDLAGFEELSSPILGLFGIRPAVGFHEGWLVVGSNRDAVQRFQAVSTGAAPTMIESEGFKKFQLEFSGPVTSIRYTDLAASTRRAAAMLSQVGLIAPVIIGMARAQARPEELQPVQELLGLLPDVARIVGKFDFLEARLSVTQGGSEPGTWTERGVTLVRPPEAESEPK